MDEGGGGQRVENSGSQWNSVGQGNSGSGRVDGGSCKVEVRVEGGCGMGVVVDLNWGRAVEISGKGEAVDLDGVSG